MYWQHHLVVTWLVPCETAASSVQVMFTLRSFTSYNHAPVHFIQSHTVSEWVSEWVSECVCVCVCVCARGRTRAFSSNLPPALLAEWQESFTLGWNGYPNKCQHRKSWPCRSKFSRCSSCRDLNQQPLHHESGTLTTEPSPLPLYIKLPKHTHLLGSKSLQQAHYRPHGVAPDDGVVNEDDPLVHKVLEERTKLLGHAQSPQSGCGLDEGATHVGVLAQHVFVGNTKLGRKEKKARRYQHEWPSPSSPTKTLSGIFQA